ncbi:hypothetical protein EYC84_007079 [Monilinia fructicola]|uniref:Uncharacterized protein n=1 Tax=Monilinia fructicola TaxID=38448 RepID=A0A5M9K610_MONFR|nr:hypothetical protein EYC84_007079 [Monilinia fructicola]
MCMNKIYSSSLIPSDNTTFGSHTTQINQDQVGDTPKSYLDNKTHPTNENKIGKNEKDSPPIPHLATIQTKYHDEKRNTINPKYFSNQ